MPTEVKLLVEGEGDEDLQEKIWEAEAGFPVMRFTAVGFELTPDYDSYAANEIPRVCYVRDDTGCKHVLNSKNYIQIEREGKVIAQGFPRFADLSLTEDPLRRQALYIILADTLDERLKGDDVDDVPASYNTSMGHITSGQRVKVQPRDQVFVWANQEEFLKQD